MNEKTMQTFYYQDKLVRTITISGVIWFAAQDICDILEIADADTAIQRLDDDEKRVGYNIPTPDGEQDITIVSETGLYRLVFNSNPIKKFKPARQFSYWVRHNILPAIRSNYAARKKSKGESIMTNAMQSFDNGKFTVRTITDNGEIWFVAKDIAQALDYERFDSNLLKSVPEIWKGTKRIRTPGGEQEMLCLTEQGLYFFLGRSDKPKALPYQMWIAGDVIPSIRKTGGYSLPNVSAPASDSLNVRLKELDAKNRELDMKGAELLQHMIDNPAYPITDESKAILAHEISKLITGHDNPAMLPVVSQPMYSATEIGSKFGISKTKVGKIANEYNLKPPIGESNEFGTWVRTKSQYSAHECPQFMYNDCALDWFDHHSEIFS